MKHNDKKAQVLLVSMSKIETEYVLIKQQCVCLTLGKVCGSISINMSHAGRKVVGEISGNRRLFSDEKMF